MPVPSPALAKQIEDAANAALKAAYTERDTIEGAINWADLHCIDVWQNASGAWMVEIAEASPEAAELQAFVADWLAEAGFGAVEVRTEW